MSQHPIMTLHGAEFAAMLIEAHISFRTTYDEYQTVFLIDVEQLKEALDLIMKLRASEL